MARLACLVVIFAAVQRGPSQAPTLSTLVGATFDVRITAVSDGDTVEALPDGDRRALRVRLEGIDAPERGEPFSEQARTFTRVLLFDKKARAEGRDVDRFGRLVARLHVAGKDASLELVRAGLACHYTDYSSDPLIAKTQAEARSNGAGFWARGAPKPRCALRDQPVDSRSTGAPPMNSLENAAFHGNIESRVYHTSRCPNFNCRNCTRAFTTEAEASAAGFRPAGDCLKKS